MPTKEQEAIWRANMLKNNPEYFNQWYHKNKDLKKRRDNRKTSKGKIIDLYDKVKQRQPDTDITKDWIENRVTSGICELTKLPFNYTIVGKRMPECPSIDRIYSSKGYFKDNCKVILCWLNIAKQDMPEDTFIRLLTKASTGYTNSV